MKLNELRTMLLETASKARKEEGKDAFKKGLVTYFKGKRIEDIYHIYSRVKDKVRPLEFNTHIKVNLVTKHVEVECTCDEFKEFKSKGYTLKCGHITATMYKFISLLPRSTSEKNIKEDTALESERLLKLIRKKENEAEYYELYKGFKEKKRILQPNELRGFLDKVKSKKLKFKFDYIEFVVPILHKDLPLTFNLKERNNSISLTTHKRLPISLNSNNDVYYFKDELYLPSKDQIEKYINIQDKLESFKEIIYRKDIENYIKLVSYLGSISKDINIDEGLKNFASSMLRCEFFVYEEKDKIYCDVLLKYGNIKINILNKKHNVLRDYKEEEKLIMKIEKNSFIKCDNRFMFIGKDEELFNILKGNENSICSLGKVTLGKELKDLKVYNSKFIKADLYKKDGYYDFSYNICEIDREELREVFEAYKDKKKFYKTKGRNFLDFQDEGMKSFLNMVEVLKINEASDYGQLHLEESKALYVYGNIKNNGLALIKDFDELENKLNNISSTNIAVSEDFNGKLREYQVKGFRWFKALSDLGFGGVLADEMGLGKTIQAIAFLLANKDKRSFIVCPTSLIYNWKEEILKFAPKLKVLIVHGTNRKKEMKNIKDYEVIITTYGTLRMDIEFYYNIIFDYFIIDEAQNIKNPKAQNTKVIKRIKAKTRFALTGTPIENNLIELWSIFDFIMPGYLYSKEKFEEKFYLDEENLRSLKFLIEPFILRRTKKEVVEELPDKIEKKFLIEMTPSQKAVYSNYVKNVKAMMKSNKDGKIEIFSYLTRLRQICLDPSIIFEEYKGGSGKLKVVLEIIKEHEGKLLLFSQFTSVLEKIEERLKKEKIKFCHLDGKTKPKDRIKMVNEFNDDKSIKVFLISLKAGGTGLNLTSANLVIHFDPWWNPAVENQATDRAHRIGQKDVVEVIKLVARGTIEEKIIELQEDKRELIDNVITGELKSSKLLNGISKEELIKLFDR
ncbi:DEAD/DEAH box helicase [Clostridium felsineum]|uniref:DEAD/DEAH box helicase n=1 Tax=Clostridium felsineum TaxID=36839 RepID=UPI00214DE49B|nr:DEAD/DEAH box helicase [Clostridium felsineum]